MEKSYKGVVVRFLRDEERGQRTQEKETPLVIEPLVSKDQKFLKEFLSSHSEQLMKDISKYGAILLRGFDMETPSEFENTVTSIKGIKAFNEILWVEPGRDLVEGTKSVFHTNTQRRTGGDTAFGGFHCENYEHPDVPRFICFYCIQPTNFGGETGVVNIAKLYPELPEKLRRKFEERNYLVVQKDLSDWSKESGLSVEDLEQFCVAAKLGIVVQDGKKNVTMFKPPVYEHPTTHEKALVINYFNSCSWRKVFYPRLLRSFFTDYIGLKWVRHHVMWYLNRQDRIAVRLKYFFQELRNKSEPPKEVDIRVGSLFNDQDVKIMAPLLRKYYSAFLWKSGDVFIIDNLKLAHAGMPGGDAQRELRALFCNRIGGIPYTKQASGVFSPRNEASESLGSEFNKMKMKKRAA